MIVDSADKWFQRATELEAENAILREALEHYADRHTWFECEDSWAYTGESTLSLPFEIAREVLARPKD